MRRQTASVLFCLLLTSWVAVGDEPLPGDARVLSGKLDNGVAWLYRQHDNPPGKMAIMIHVDTGSLNETDEQRGLAHFIEHMAFNGSEHFPPGELIPYFESIGMQFGADVNAFTSFDQTAYMVFLPDTTAPQVDKALMVLSDYAFRLSLLPEEIEKERGVILSELRAGMSAQQRIRDEMFEKLFTGTRFGQRMPIGKQEVIAQAGKELFEAYYRTWYRPERVTVLMVGDAPHGEYLEALQKWFGEYHAPVAARDELGPEFKPFTQERAIVISDPEYARGQVAFYDIGRGRGPTTTVAQARAELVERIGSWITDRRLAERVKKGQASFVEANTAVFDFFGDGLLVTGAASGEPADWEKMLAELLIEISRAREFGFLPGEFELCKKELLASAEDDVRKEPTLNARAVLFTMLSAVNDEEPLLSAQQELELLQKLLPTITLPEVSKTFADHFAPGNFAYVVTIPEKEDVALPGEDDVLAAARAALARKPEPPTDVTLHTDLLTAEPAPGSVTETTFDEDLQITSGWLANGVRFHHRYMDYKRDSVWLSITLAGGQIEETADNAGVTVVASLILDQPATTRLSSTEIQDLMTGKNISVGGDARDDSLTVSVSGSPIDLETGLRLAYALLTDGKLEHTAFDKWKQQSLQRYEMASKMPQFAAFRAWIEAITGNDPRRPLMLTPAQLEQQSVARSQAWYEQLCRTAPIEVAVVGDIQLDTVRSLLEKYVGSLSPRPRSADHLDPLRRFSRPSGPLERHVRVETITPQAWVVFGFLSTDAQNTDDVRALQVAANILDSQLIKQIREERALVYSIGAQSRPDAAYRDAGFFLSGAPCEPGKQQEVIAEIRRIFDAFAADGPTATELENARKQIVNQLDKELKEPRFWFTRLGTLNLHDMHLEQLKNIPAAYEAIPAEQVRAVFAKYYQPQRVFEISAVPAETPQEAEAPTP